MTHEEILAKYQRIAHFNGQEYFYIDKEPALKAMAEAVNQAFTAWQKASEESDYIMNSFNKSLEQQLAAKDKELFEMALSYDKLFFENKAKDKEIAELKNDVEALTAWLNP